MSESAIHFDDAVEAFKAGWELADEYGLEGKRVETGLMYALPYLRNLMPKPLPERNVETTFYFNNVNPEVIQILTGQEVERDPMDESDKRDRIDDGGEVWRWDPEAQVWNWGLGSGEDWEACGSPHRTLADAVDYWGVALEFAE